MIKQGDIFWANLNPTIGHEQKGLRPVLILQNNLLNEDLNTVIVAPITTNLEAKGFLTTYFLKSVMTGLKHDSLALLYQLRAIDKKRLNQKAGKINAGSFLEIRHRLALVF